LQVVEDHLDQKELKSNATNRLALDEPHTGDQQDIRQQLSSKADAEPWMMDCLGQQEEQQQLQQRLSSDEEQLQQRLSSDEEQLQQQRLSSDEEQLQQQRLSSDEEQLQQRLSSDEQKVQQKLQQRLSSGEEQLQQRLSSDGEQLQQQRLSSGEEQLQQQWLSSDEQKEQQQLQQSAFDSRVVAAAGKCSADHDGGEGVHHSDAVAVVLDDECGEVDPPKPQQPGVLQIINKLEEVVAVSTGTSRYR
jgi:DNA repair exonuclease SbcCD ATPase subunit